MKRTITIELERVKIVSRRNRGRLLFCEFCQTETEFVSRAEAAEIANLLGANDLTENKNLHFYQPEEEQIFICLNSILSGNNPENYKK